MLRMGLKLALCENYSVNDYLLILNSEIMNQLHLYFRLDLQIFIHLLQLIIFQGIFCSPLKKSAALNKLNTH